MQHDPITMRGRRVELDQWATFDSMSNTTNQLNAEKAGTGGAGTWFCVTKRAISFSCVSSCWYLHACNSPPRCCLLPIWKALHHHMSHYHICMKLQNLSSSRMILAAKASMQTEVGSPNPYIVGEIKRLLQLDQHFTTVVRHVWSNVAHYLTLIGHPIMRTEVWLGSCQNQCNSHS